MSLIRGERLLVIQGSRAYAAGRFDDAIAAFERALAVAPASVPARVNLASALLQRGDVARGVEQLRAAFALAPADLTVGRQLASALVRLERRDEAIEVLSSMRRADPGDEDSVVGLAILLAERQRFGEAIAVLDDAQRRISGRAATATTLARLLASSPELARRDGARALELAMEVYQAEPGAVARRDRGAGAGRARSMWRSAGVDAPRRVGRGGPRSDAAELARLRAETPRYRRPSCRAPGR